MEINNIFFHVNTKLLLIPPPPVFPVYSQYTFVFSQVISVACVCLVLYVGVVLYELLVHTAHHT